jgi:transmembrane sensor
MDERRPADLPPEIREQLEGKDPAEREELRRMWELLGRAGEERPYDVDSAWEELSRRMDGPTRDEGPARGDASTRTAGREASLGTRPAAWRWAAAAVLFLAAAGGFAWWWTAPVSRAAPAGQQVTVTLPDGSTARLNAASRITYPRGFRSFPGTGADRRGVRLEGEAYFDVRPGRRPFRVETANAAVRVLGTRFTVRARGGPSGVTEVVLVEGRVRLRSGPRDGAAGAAVDLERPGHASRVPGPGDPTEPVIRDVARATAWVRGGFSMTGAPVPEVLAELERRFDTRVRLRAPEAADDTLTLHYGSRVGLEDVLRDLATIQGLRFRETARGYELYRE